MRRGRLKVTGENGVGYYHCVSRVVQRQFLFGEVERERFVEILREYEEFCGVRLLTYCVMSNHFHLLVEVPRRPEVLPDADEVMRRLRKLSCVQFLGAFEQTLAAYRRHQDEAGEKQYLERYYRRMWDVSWFLRLVKQRFSSWYNHRHERKGTLWEERFKSVVVDGAGPALLAMAAYMDLNPVRAGVVKDPKDYRWSGYGEAVAGRKQAQAGIQAVMNSLRPGLEEREGKLLEQYRMQVFAVGSEAREHLTGEGRLVRGAIAREEVAAVLSAKGKLPLAEYLQCRVRYFCDGAVLGSREFVETVFRSHRDRFGPKRTTGARRMRGLDTELYSARDLQKEVFG